jgi:hypothetical protein
MPAPINLARIVARIRPILDAVGIDYSTSHPTRIRGFRTWTRGARVVKHARFPDPAFYIEGRNDYRTDDALRDRAIIACRGAGWTVDDDGRIRDIPPKE